MKPCVVLLVVASTYVASAGGAAEEPPGLSWQEISPPLSDAILFNPGMGLYLAGGGRLSYQPPPDAWALTLCDIVYFRPGWCDVEGEGPGSGFDEYFGPIFDFWVKQRGKRVAFRVMSESMHSRSKYVTPKWVFDRGVPGVTHRGLYAPEQIDPVFWDERYLKEAGAFVSRLGKYLDGRSGLEFVDIGAIGEWGEMHLGQHLPGRWTPDQLAETGFTRTKYVAAYRRIIDAYAEAFPHTRVFLNVGSYAQINDYAALRGCHFRQDGLTPHGPSAHVGKLYYRPYSRRGVVCNYEFHSSYSSMLKKGWDLRATVERGLSDPISYLNTNILSPAAWETAPAEVKKVFVHAARRIGFRFVLTKLKVASPFHVDGSSQGRLIIEHTWKNIGVAPCYESYALEFSLRDAGGRVVARQLVFPRKPTTLWWSGEGTTEHTLLRVPAGTRPGTYTLRVAMLLPEDLPGRRRRNILLGIAGRDQEDGYILCQVTAVATGRKTGVVYRQPFESAGHGWLVAEGIDGALEATTAHGGDASLHLKGTQRGSFNFVYHQLDVPLLPGSRYRLSCWLKVDKLSPKSLRPYLKVGLTNVRNEWLTNCVTSRYDTGHMGRWQHLQGTLETTTDTAGGHLALEKGTKETAVTLDAWLDDVELELLEAP